MNSNYDSIFKFTQLYVNAINLGIKENNPIDNLLIFSKIENYFGNDFLRIYVGVSAPLEGHPDAYHSIFHGEAEYYAYSIKSKNDHLFPNDEDDRWRFYYNHYNEYFSKYTNDVNYFIGVIKAAFPKLKIINKLKNYSVPYSWIGSVEDRNFSNWYEESLFYIPTIVNSLVEGVNENVYSIKRIKPHETIVQELEEQERKEEELKEEKKKQEKELEEKKKYGEEVFSKMQEELTKPSEMELLLNNK